MATTTVLGSGRLYLASNASLGTSFGTHTVEEATITQSGEAPVESQVAGSYALIAVKNAMKLELTATYVTTDTVSLPDHGSPHTLANMPSITWNSVANALNEVAVTGKWTLTGLTNPVAYDQVSRCTATFTKWAGIVRS